MTIRNPVEWGADFIADLGRAVGAAGHDIYREDEDAALPLPAIRRLDLSDLGVVLRRGLRDFAECRTDVIFLCLIYPVIGLVLSRAAMEQAMLPLIFPLAAGFALIGPLAGIGLYELSRQREKGASVNWLAALKVLKSPSIAGILLLGLVLVTLFFAWQGVAISIYNATLGPQPPASLAAFIHDVLNTPAGLTMTVIVLGVGFLFALAVLTISVVSFPMMVDIHVRMDVAVLT